MGRADRIFARVGEKLKASFEGGLTEPLAALLIISMSTDWDFYFMPVDLDGRYGHGDYIDCHHETNLRVVKAIIMMAIHIYALES